MNLTIAGATCEANPEAMNANGTELSSAASDLLSAAVRFSQVAAKPGSSTGLTGAMTRLEDALRVLSTAIHDTAADAAPNFRPRFGPGGSIVATEGKSPLGELSRGEEAKLATVILETANALGACAHIVGENHAAVASLTRSKREAEAVT